MRRIFFPFVFCGLVMSSGGAQSAKDEMNTVAERYMHLVLALGQHDPDYVDAFYGPAEWKTQAEKEKKALDAIGAEATELRATLAKTLDAGTSGDEMLRLRHAGRTGSNLKGVLPKSRFLQNNSTQTRGDLVKDCSHHDG